MTSTDSHIRHAKKHITKYSRINKHLFTYFRILICLQVVYRRMSFLQVPLLLRSFVHRSSFNLQAVKPKIKATMPDGINTIYYENELS